MPTITWTPESLATLTTAMAPMAGVDAGAINEVLGVVLDTGIKLSLQVPPADGAEPVDIPEEVDVTMAEPDLGEFAAPFFRASATYNQTELQQLGTLETSELAQYGIALPANLPPDVAAMLYALGASEVKAATGPGHLDLRLDGDSALMVNYDVDACAVRLPSLGRSWKIRRSRILASHSWSMSRFCLWCLAQILMSPSRFNSDTGP
ncbi:MAG: hypothetical protein HC802_08645 [Caldilineaceae bacterium]|nr:hypothetical protein [Caldilineaceae bacterium]